MNINKTDAAFYFFQSGLIVKEITEGISKSHSGESVDWLVLGLTIVSSLLYAFYNKLTNMTDVKN